MARTLLALTLALAVWTILVGAGAASGGGPTTVRPSSASKCFRSSHWHVEVQRFRTSRGLLAMGRFYRGTIPQTDGWWVHFYSNRADLDDERTQLRKVLVAPFVALLVRRGNDLMGWEGPNLPTAQDRQLRDRCFPR